MLSLFLFPGHIGWTLDSWRWRQGMPSRGSRPKSSRRSPPPTWGCARPAGWSSLCVQSTACTATGASWLLYCASFEMDHIVLYMCTYRCSLSLNHLPVVCQVRTHRGGGKGGGGFFQRSSTMFQTNLIQCCAEIYYCWAADVIDQ